MRTNSPDNKDNINATGKEGNSALSLAKSEGYTQIASLLEEAGAISRPIKDSFLNIKRSLKKIFYPKKTDEGIQLRQTATKSEDKKNHSSSLFERITSFIKGLF
ncbi:MAG: hypothetical protein OXB86_06470 [Bdellovibrionales bacterium]|nr:hypothetical protein [Bdellovibrionales bacterium]